MSFRAEWTKLVRHRSAMFWLLGIYPTLAAVFLGITMFVATRPATVRMIDASLSNWGDLLLLSWRIPNNFFGRLFLVAFTAFAFAVEYQWGTWKNLTPRLSRRRLVLTKFAVTSLLVILTFVVLSLVLAVGGVVLCRLAGVSVEPAFDGAHIASVLGDYVLGASLAFLSFLITGVFAALGAISSRTILGGTLFGMVMVFVDPALLYGSRFAARVLDSPLILQLQRFSPFYNIENTRAWIELGGPSTMLDESFGAMQQSPPGDPALFSAVVLVAWVVAGIYATAHVFERQDITS